MTREALPQRCNSETLTFRVGRLEYTATIGYYGTGDRIGEIFIDCSKSGTDAATLARDSAIVASFALQFGASVDDLRAALSRAADGSAEGPSGRLLDILAVPRMEDHR